MSPICETYGQALYTLAKDEGLTQPIGQELAALQESFRDCPDFIRLLCAPSLSKAERCGILDDSFRGKLQPYLLSFLKLLTQKGYMRHFDGCCQVYAQAYDKDHGILPVTAITAYPMEDSQVQRLTEKLGAKTCKTIRLLQKVDPACIGGIRLEYDGKLVDDTIAHRLDSIGKMLKNTVI